MLWTAWEILCDSAFFVLLGFLLAGVLDAFVSRLPLMQLLHGNGRRSVFWATLIGMPLPLCSCSVLPSALTLRRRGAGKGATLSFLISTPETGMTSILLTYGLIGPFMAVCRPVVACITAVVAGLTQNAIERRSERSGAPGLAAQGVAEGEGCCAGCRTEVAAPPASIGSRLRAALRYTFGQLFDDVFGWVILGIIAAAALHTWVPADVLSRIIGGPWQSMLLMLVVGIPLYVCAEASTPIAAALIASGLSPGAALVFLLAGPATNIGAIGVLSRQMGRRTVAIYLGSIACVALAAGAITNALVSGPVGAAKVSLSQKPLLPEWLETLAALAFLGLGFASTLRLRYLPRMAAWSHARLSRPVWTRATTLSAALLNTLSGRPAAGADAVVPIEPAMISEGGTEKWTSRTGMKSSSSR